MSDPTALEPKDPATLRSAQGYYELGMIAECDTALKELAAEDLLTPDGLELSILLNLDRKHYAKTLELCETAIQLYPKVPFGFVNKAFVLHEINQTEKSLQVLEESHLVVAIEPVAVYNRGCYLACLTREKEAIFWVNKAIRLSPALYSDAMKDPDLEGIRDRLEPCQ